jgi:hypothetical protein
MNTVVNILPMRKSSKGYNKMARQKIDDLEPVALWRKTAHRLRIISKLTGQSMIQVADIALLKMAKELETEIAIFEKISKEAQSNGNGKTN